MRCLGSVVVVWRLRHRRESCIQSWDHSCLRHLYGKVLQIPEVGGGVSEVERWSMIGFNIGSVAWA